MLSLEFKFIAVLKLSDWAENLSESVDFIDYWYNLFLSKTKFEIESNFLNNINAFHWTRWQDDFEAEYQPQLGKSYSPEERAWFAFYIQYLIFAFRISSKEFAKFYKKDVFKLLMDDWFQFHCLGVDQFISRFIKRYGLPSSVTEVIDVGM